jgi:hypothetical protein
MMAGLLSHAHRPTPPLCLFLDQERRTATGVADASWGWGHGMQAGRLLQTTKGQDAGPFRSLPRSQPLPAALVRGEGLSFPLHLHVHNTLLKDINLDVNSRSQLANC